jgi:hypothetical protein
MSECFNLCRSMEYYASVNIVKYPCTMFDSIKRRKWNFFIFSLCNGHCVSFQRETFYFLYAFYFFTSLSQNYACWSLPSSLLLSLVQLCDLFSLLLSSALAFHLQEASTRRNFVSIYFSFVVADNLCSFKMMSILGQKYFDEDKIN